MYETDECDDLRRVDDLKNGIEATVSNFIQRLRDLIHAEEVRLHEKRASFDRERSNWIQQQKLEADIIAKRREELNAMAKHSNNDVPVASIINDSELLELNVGGGIFAVQRSTLCQGDTMLAAMFGGRWNETTFGRDSDGRVYLELNRECFEVLVEWLRARVIDSEVPPPLPPEGKLEIFQNMMTYLQMDALMERDLDTLEWKKLQNACVSRISTQGTALGRDPSAIFDDDDSRGWSSQSGCANGSWIIVDLKECIRFTKVRVDVGGCAGGLVRAITLYRSGSEDGPWTEVSKYTHEGMVTPTECIFPPCNVQAQFLRVVFHSNDRFVAVRRFCLA